MWRRKLIFFLRGTFNGDLLCQLFSFYLESKFKFKKEFVRDNTFNERVKAKKYDFIDCTISIIILLSSKKSQRNKRRKKLSLETAAHFEIPCEICVQ